MDRFLVSTSTESRLSSRGLPQLCVGWPLLAAELPLPPMVLLVFPLVFSPVPWKRCAFSSSRFLLSVRRLGEFIAEDRGEVAFARRCIGERPFTSG
jgi:hypothetical protein